MVIREELIEGAISFLQDPSVASAPLEQRIAFLRSKNLTQDEIDASLSRVGQSPSTTAPLPPSTSYPSQQQYQQQPSRQQYGAYQQQQQYWPNQPPPELPRRDWRDYFIMATLTSTLGYSLYWAFLRYVQPVIAPPTPPQITQDKEHIDTSFDRAFALLDQLAADTAALKTSEQTRTERLDAALADVEAVVGKMRAANEEREAEAKRMARELAEIRDLVPKAIEREKEATDVRLRDLVGEMKSLKTLVGNRMSGQQANTSTTIAGVSTQRNAPSFAGAPAASAAPNVTAPETVSGTDEAPAAPPATSTNTSTYGRMLGAGQAQIPSWQLAAKKRSEDATAAAAKKEGGGIAESGTAVVEKESTGEVTTTAV